MILLVAVCAMALVGIVPIWLELRRRRRLRQSADLPEPQAEPCWSEELRGEGQLRFGRYQCLNDELMDMDRRASRGDFPVPPVC